MQLKADEALRPKAGVSVVIVVPIDLSDMEDVIDFEKGRRVPTHNNLAAIRAALEAAGVEFIPQNGSGAGVRLKKAIQKN